MNNKNFDDIEMSRDIYSSSKRNLPNHYEDISSSSKKKKYKKKKHKRKNTAVKILSLLIIFLGLVLIGMYAYGYSIINNIQKATLDEEDLGIESDVYSDVKNIALLGLDTRNDNTSGRSDANIILTIDKKNKKIKLTSIARDTYVAIDGKGNDKLTHAYAYGKSQLAVKTLNKNFGLEITDYVTINFFGLARIIDYLGGVTIDVSKAELKDLNNNIIPYTDFGDIPCKKIKSAGVQKLTGAQAVCYARIRHVDSDLGRGNRQKEVLTAMFDAAKDINILKLPEVAEMILGECETSLSSNDIIALGTWAVTASPKFEQLSIPNDNVPASGKTIKGVWYYVVDIEKAKQEMHDFIFEENYYSPEEVAKRENPEDEES